eukprot:4534087-Prymnesium_polylepis.1
MDGGTLASTSGNDNGCGSAPVLVEHEASDTATDPDQPASASGDTLQPQVTPLADETGTRTFSLYSVTREEQARDPALHLIVSQLKSGRNRVGAMSQLQRTYEMNDGLPYRCSVSHEGEPCLELMVPRHGIGPCCGASTLHFTAATNLCTKRLAVTLAMLLAPNGYAFKVFGDTFCRFSVVSELLEVITIRWGHATILFVA